MCNRITINSMKKMEDTSQVGRLLIAATNSKSLKFQINDNPLRRVFYCQFIAQHKASIKQQINLYKILTFCLQFTHSESNILTSTQSEVRNECSTETKTRQLF